MNNYESLMNQFACWVEFQIGQSQSYGKNEKAPCVDYRATPVSYTHLTLPTTPYV